MLVLYYFFNVDLFWVFFLINFNVDYAEKAEDAVDYEDIEEQYEGPEVQVASEEDHLLPKKEFFSAEVSLASLEHKTSVFDEENYDEDGHFDKEPDVVENKPDAQTTLSGC